MHVIVSPALFGAHALPAPLHEPHARVGNHLRLHHHPLLGLPVAPFVVEWAEQELKALKRRNAVHFYAANGSELLPPFNVTPGHPVTARIATRPNELCIYAVLAAEPLERAPEPSQPVVLDPVRPPLTGLRPLPPALPSLRPGVPALVRSIPGASSLRVSAYVSGPSGPALIGRRSGPRYGFSGPGLVELRIEGSGRVHGLEWIEAHDEQRLQYQPLTLLALPHPGGARYLGVVDAKKHAQARVTAQRPHRRPLQETTGAPAPSAAPAFSNAEERDRVDSLSTLLDPDLHSLIDDLGTPPLEQAVTETIRDENGKPVGSASTRRLHRVNQLQADPGTASLLGYKMLDPRYVETEDRLVFYRVDGYFNDFPEKPLSQRKSAELAFDLMLNLVPEEKRRLDRPKLLEWVGSQVQRTEGFELEKTGQFAEGSRYVAITTVAVADRMAPLDPTDAPSLEEAKHQEWLPAVPPAAVRHVELSLADVMTTALLAAGKRTPATGVGTFEPLNAANTKGWHLPLVLSLSTDAAGQPNPPPGTGFIADRKAGPEAIRYFVSQQDRFGRFSDWAVKNAEVGQRPKPPRPDVLAYYTLVPVAAAATRGGDIVIHVPVPDNDALAPGSHPLDHVSLRLHDERLGTVTTLTDAVTNRVQVQNPQRPGEFRMQLTTQGPVLDATEQRYLRITARWFDSAGQDSRESEPFLLRMTDARPPAQLSVPDRLLYSARPDVTGLAWIEHRWVPVAGQARYGVYYTDENRLRSHLASTGRNDILLALQQAPHAAARATLLRTHRALFPDHLFERLEGVLRDTATGQAFRHAVSGSLRVLSAYKIAAESASGARPPLVDLDLILYGVPNADPPPRPTVSVRRVDPVQPEPELVAEISISVSPGATAGQSWRLRRTATSSSSPLALPLVSSGSLAALDPDSGTQSATVRDTGPLQIASTAVLKPWVRYAWIAEVQGGPESGSVEAGRPVPGLWSAPSDPVTLILVPASAPAALDVTLVKGPPQPEGFPDVMLSFTHPGPLQGGVMGSFRARLARRLPGGALQVVSEREISADRTFSLPGGSSGELIPAQTEYVATLIDPVGRASPPVSIRVLPGE